MAVVKSFKVRDEALASADIKAALEQQFPSYKVYTQKALKLGKLGPKDGQYVQVDKSLMAGVMVVLGQNNRVTIQSNIGNIFLRAWVGWLAGALFAGSLVTEVGDYLKATYE